jgi:hypothetical protein
VGAIIGEVIGKTIPEQRMQRLEVYVRYLNERLGQMNETEARKRATDPENIALFEDGAIQSARALSDERRAYIAKLVAQGGSVRDVVGIMSGIISDELIIAYYAARSNC